MHRDCYRADPAWLLMDTYRDMAEKVVDSSIVKVDG